MVLRRVYAIAAFARRYFLPVYLPSMLSNPVWRRCLAGVGFEF